MQGLAASAAVDFALRDGRDEIKFIVGDYPQDVRQLIHDGKIFGTVDQDPYPQAYNAIKWPGCISTERKPRVQKPYYLPVATGDEGERRGAPAAWGC